MDILFSIDKQTTEWRFDPEQLQVRISSKWGAKSNCIVNPDPIYSHEIEIRDQDATDTILLDNNRCHIALDSTISFAAEFAVWLREQVPPTVTLHCYDLDYSFHVVVTNDVTSQAIVDAYEDGRKDGKGLS
jgi:hypothetical protein